MHDNRIALPASVSVQECKPEDGKCTGVIVQIPPAELENFDKREIGAMALKHAFHACKPACMKVIPERKFL